MKNTRVYGRFENTPSHNFTEHGGNYGTLDNDSLMPDFTDVSGTRNFIIPHGTPDGEMHAKR